MAYTVTHHRGGEQDVWIHPRRTLRLSISNTVYGSNGRYTTWRCHTGACPDFLAGINSSAPSAFPLRSFLTTSEASASDMSRPPPSFQTLHHRGCVAWVEDFLKVDSELGSHLGWGDGVKSSDIQNRGTAPSL